MQTSVFTVENARRSVKWTSIHAGLLSLPNASAAVHALQPVLSVQSILDLASSRPKNRRETKKSVIHAAVPAHPAKHVGNLKPTSLLHTASGRFF